MVSSLTGPNRGFTLSTLGGKGQVRRRRQSRDRLAQFGGHSCSPTVARRG